MNNQALPYLIAITITRRCNLSCAHCYLDAQQRKDTQEGELTVEEYAALFSEIGQRAPGTIMVLTGGEPLLHPKIENLVSWGVKAGLRVVIGTNGILLQESSIQRFQELGLAGVGISIDSVYPDQHDSFRGQPGSFAKSCTAIRLCAVHQLHAQIHFTVTRNNWQQLEQMVHLGQALGVPLIHFFFLVCIGRGKSTMDLSADLYESSLKEIARLQKQYSGMLIQSRCTPSFKRILYQNDPESPYTRATGYDGGGCLAGTHYCRIDPLGNVTPCPYMELTAGNIRQTPFWQIWEQAPLFHSLRNPDLQGRCGRCEFKWLCGGCRARSVVETGNLMGEDSRCSYSPTSGKIVVPKPSSCPENEQAQWTEEALAHLKKIPLFLQGMVKKRLEEKAKTMGVPITVEFMQTYRKERENELGMRFT